jgi:hypothetical protein
LDVASQLEEVATTIRRSEEHHYINKTAGLIVDKMKGI